MTSRLVCLIGADGSGKTTLAQGLLSEFHSKGYAARYVWFRFPHFSTLIVLLASRLTHLTRYTSDGRLQVALHPFHRQPFRALYPLTILFDTTIFYFLKVWIPLRLGYSIVCDRWVHDILVDIAVDTRNPDLSQAITCRALLVLARKADMIMFLDATDEELDKRRPETRLDPYTGSRRALYRSFCGSSEIDCIRSDDDTDVLEKHVLELVKQKTGISFSGQNAKSYANVKMPILRRILESKYAILLSNWTFQGSLEATWSERIFRLGLDLIFGLTAFVALSRFLPMLTAALSSLLVAHTINWTLNGNSWATLKHAGRKYNLQRNTEFLKNLENRGQKRQEYTLALIVFGSLSRGQFTERSDIDMRIVRKRGILNCLQANILALRLRASAFIRKIPLDLFVLDSIDQAKMQTLPDEVPVVIYDPSKTASMTYGRSISLDAALRTSKSKINSGI